MNSGKRNILSPSRKGVLAQPEVVYTVRCNGTTCNCEHYGVDCRRGFFSLWIQAVYGMYFAKKLNIKSYIDFGDKPYLYSDPGKFDGNLNFWSYYYLQEPRSEERTIPNLHEECYPLRIWSRAHFRKIHQSVIKSMVLRPDAKEYIDTVISTFGESKTLGVHIRMTDHDHEVPAVSIERYLRFLHRYKDRFQKFYIATDYQGALKLLSHEFGADKVVFQDATRSENQQAVHTDLQHTDRYRLGLEVLTDCYALASCQYALLVHSNVSYGSLLLNPRLPYRLLETKESFYSRWKTGLLFLLDDWGIRKM